MNSNRSEITDVLDTLITALREHEKHLDEAVEKLSRIEVKAKPEARRRCRYTSGI